MSVKANQENDPNPYHQFDYETEMKQYQEEQKTTTSSSPPPRPPPGKPQQPPSMPPPAPSFSNPSPPPRSPPTPQSSGLTSNPMISPVSDSSGTSINNTAPPVEKGVSTGGGTNRFKGQKRLTYILWAYYLILLSCVFNFVSGIFAIAWNHVSHYGCKVDGEYIHESYVFSNGGPYGTCNPNNEVCCLLQDDDDFNFRVWGNDAIGYLYIFSSIIIVLLEHPTYGFGQYMPNDSWEYQHRFSIRGFVYFIIGCIGLGTIATVLGGFCMMTAAAVLMKGTYDQECGDGGRERRKQQSKEKKRKAETIELQNQEEETGIMNNDVFAFFKKIKADGRLPTYIWVSLYVLANILIFFTTLHSFYQLFHDMRDDLMDGTLELYCSSRECKVNEKMIQYGPISDWAPWAKANGNCLNFNCSLILVPVVKLILRNINDLGLTISSKNAMDQGTPGARGSTASASSSFSRAFSSLLAHPIARYIPLSKNIEFHKLIAFFTGVFAVLHTLFHFLNLTLASNTTLVRFEKYGWEGTTVFTGAIISYAQFLIYTSAPQTVKNASYELFFNTHHWFTVFFFFLMFHGPVFFYWSCIPIALYVMERYLEVKRGNVVFKVMKMEYSHPVMALYLAPLHSNQFKFKEGEYLHLNSPSLAAEEWHPFTISSASDDLTFGPRVCLETGQEVKEVPRPSYLHPKQKWKKYCLMSQDFNQLEEFELLDGSEVGYLDHLTLHIKVHGSESWTRKLRNYLFQLHGTPIPDDSPKKGLETTQILYFHSRDHRGDNQIGRIYGFDFNPIIRVDGPHVAPAIHYGEYGTCMLIGAGIGLTPCCSILSALLKYRWKRNFSPEIVHFYWVVRNNEVPAYQWFIQRLWELEYELKRNRDYGQIDMSYYVEINIYVTGRLDEEEKASIPPFMFPSSRQALDPYCEPFFMPEQLYDAMMNPTVKSSDQVTAMQDVNTPNRFQDVFIWKGRPVWNDIFSNIRDIRQHPDIGVCFCGTPVIGKDLKDMCEKYSDDVDDVIFHLHKENF